MTIKDLQRIIQEHESSANDSAVMQDLMDELRDRPFYIWSKDKHKAASSSLAESKGYCCFNHIIGLPKKDGKEFPLFDYENIVYKALTQDSYLNNRSPTQEEEEKFGLIKIELEDKVNSKKESIKKGTRRISQTEV